MIRLAIVEDEKEYRDQLLSYIEQYKAETKQDISFRVFEDGEDITEKYTAEFDLVLMDIQMRFMDGMTAAREIRKKDKKVLIMFITSMANYAIQGYEVDALDYLLKPLTYPMFSQKMTRALSRIDNSQNHHLLITTSDGNSRIDVSKIYYIESQSHTMTYHTAEGLLESRGRMDDLEKQLAPYDFYRSNRGYLVNLRHVTGVTDGCCVIDGDMLPVSRRKKSDFLDKLSRIL